MAAPWWLAPFVVLNALISVAIIMFSSSPLIVIKDSATSTVDSLFPSHHINSSSPKQCPEEYQPSSALYDHHAALLMQYSPLNASNLADFQTSSILILTPISNSKEFLNHFFMMLCSLTYPHHLIKVVLGEDSSTDDTFAYANAISKRFRPYFRDIQVLRLEADNATPIPYNLRHKRVLQGQRRGRMAKARNQLLMRAMSNEDWVLWIDVDMYFYPPDIIEHLMSANHPIAVPNCLAASADLYRYTIYDKNTWRETNSSRRFLSRMPERYLQVEGYATSRRQFLADIIDEGTVVTLDGVGGCVLLVEGAQHRAGLVFPSFVFNHHIETEGLAKMATSMNISIAGLPFVNTVHS